MAEGLKKRELIGDCRVCAQQFRYQHAGPGRRRLYCSSVCKEQVESRSRNAINCATCGQSFHPRYGKIGGYCSVKCRPNGRKYEGPAERIRASAQRRRALKKRVSVEQFSALEVFQRDGWACGICGKAVDPAAKWPDRMSASLDHVVPLAHGGAHSRANAQLAHWICNSRKTSKHNGLFARAKSNADRLDHGTRRI